MRSFLPFAGVLMGFATVQNVDAFVAPGKARDVNLISLSTATESEIEKVRCSAGFSSHPQAVIDDV